MIRKNKAAISLIILVITIIVLSILATIVIISISNTDVINESRLSVFKADMTTYNDMYDTYIVKRTLRDMSFDETNLNLTYMDEEYGNIFGDVSDKYKENLKIVSGYLVYETKSDAEKDILKEIGMKVFVTKDTNALGKSPYIGCFADVDGDGNVDGVIFADLLEGWSAESYEDYWARREGGSFNITPKKVSQAEVKNYYVSQESYTVTNSEGEILAGYESKSVLTAIGGGKDRFYVMALSDFETAEHSTFYWYYNGNVTNYSEVTAYGFGTGKSNTHNMIEKWNLGEASNGGYGAQNARDLWGVIQQKVYGPNYANDIKEVEDVIWFLPSIEEWCAFAKAFNITSSSYIAMGLSGKYYSSTSWNAYGVRQPFFDEDTPYGGGIYWFNPIRLATTF